MGDTLVWEDRDLWEGAGRFGTLAATAGPGTLPELPWLAATLPRPLGRPRFGEGEPIAPVPVDLCWLASLLRRAFTSALRRLSCPSPSNGGAEAPWGMGLGGEGAGAGGVTFTAFFLLFFLGGVSLSLSESSPSKSEYPLPRLNLSPDGASDNDDSSAPSYGSVGG